MAVLTMNDDSATISDKIIKPCPFCGNDSLELTSDDIFDTVCHKNGSGMISISCHKCDAEKKVYSIPGNNYWLGVGILIGEWNRRVNDGD